MLVAAVALAAAIVAGATAAGDHEPRYRPLPSDAPWTSVLKTAVGLEGLTADRHGNLYTPGRGAAPCPTFRTRPSGGPPAVVGNIPAPCNPAGLAFDGADLFVADGNRIVTLRPSAAEPPTATVYATDVPGANGVACDSRGSLWVTDGTTAQGRTWRIGRDRTPVEVLRVQPMANDVNLVDGVGGVGRDPPRAPARHDHDHADRPPGRQHARLTAPVVTDEGRVIELFRNRSTRRRGCATRGRWSSPPAR